MYALCLQFSFVLEIFCWQHYGLCLTQMTSIGGSIVEFSIYFYT